MSRDISLAISGDNDKYKQNETKVVVTSNLMHCLLMAIAQDKRGDEP